MLQDILQKMLLPLVSLKKCLVQVAYAIGVAQPVSVYVNTKGTGKISDEKFANMIKKEVDLTPRGIIDRLKLRRPIYQKDFCIRSLWTQR